MFIVASHAFNQDEDCDLNRLKELENDTDVLKEQLASNHFKRIKKKECKNELSPFHSTLLSELERIADHLTNIGYSIVNPTGDEIIYR